MNYRLAICQSCEIQHLVGRKSNKQGVKMQRFHLRRLMQNVNKAPSWEPMATSTNKPSIARKMANQFVNAEDQADQRDCMIWDYKTGREVCPIAGITWAEKGTQQ